MVLSSKKKREREREREKKRAKTRLEKMKPPQLKLKNKFMCPCSWAHSDHVILKYPGLIMISKADKTK